MENTLSAYEIGKARAIDEAIEWQHDIVEDRNKPSLDDFVDEQEHFYKLGKRYGLLKEFRENGII